MSKSKTKRNKYSPESFETSKPNGHWVRFYADMLNSEAYKTLSHKARTALIVLKLQYKGNFTGSTVVCPYKEFQQYGMNTTTIKKALMELEEKGFVKISYGARQINGNLHRQPNEYEFIDAWKSYSGKDDKNITS